VTVGRRGAMRTGLIAVAFLAVAMAACQPAAAPTATPSPTPAASSTPLASATPVAADAILVTVSVTGGECPNGPCGAEYVVKGDGRVDGPAGGPTTIPPETVARIVSLAASTDWDAVRSVPFASMCPTAYDGQKRVYAFPAAGGDLVFDSCEFDLSNVPVFQAIDAALFGG
jgi:hypothetical protein